MRPLTLVHLYPREMNIYGDTGNVIVLRRRLEWRGLECEVVPVHLGDPLPFTADIVLGGGGQDAAQGEIGHDLVSRASTLRAMAYGPTRRPPMGAFCSGTATRVRSLEICPQLFVRSIVPRLL